MLVLLLFILGLFIGSFLNVIIDRLPRDESFLKGRSYCESCRHPLSGRDLVPLFSFYLLKGKCRYCHIKLSYQYPLLEGLTGLFFAATYIFIPKSGIIDIIFALIIVSVLIVVFFIDLFKGIIPFLVLIPAMILTFMYLLTIDQSTMIIHWVSALIAGGFFLLLFLGTKGRGMGFGDVVYAFFMGLLLGFPSSVIGFYIAFLTGAVVSLILIVLKRKKFKGGTIPFGPFLVLGTYVAFLWGNQITNFFFRIVL